MNVKRLLRECRKQSGYAHGHKWEPGMDFEKSSPNFPFKPGYVSVEGLPHNGRGDQWGGDLGDWEDALSEAKPGTTLDFYVSRMDFGEVEELETNFDIWIVSETEAWCQDCGGKPFKVTVPE
jgi:hypothetical protein